MLPLLNSRTELERSRQRNPPFTERGRSADRLCAASTIAHGRDFWLGISAALKILKGDWIMRKFVYSFVVILVLHALWLPSIAAQEAKSSIAGTVKDSSNSALTGALVELQPGGRRAVSDDQGQYRITDLAPGEYPLTASYLGFSPFTMPVKVDAGQVANVDAVLAVASRNDQLIVTAEQLQGETEAIHIERTADNIVQVLPARVINSLPNTNIADAVGRALSVTLERDEGEGKYIQIRGTEPRLCNVTVNGVTIPPAGGKCAQYQAGRYSRGSG